MKHLYKWGGVIASLLVLASLMVGCKSDDDDDAPPSQPSYTVKVELGIQNGSVTANPTSATAGTNVTLTVTPDTGYQLKTITVTKKDGSEITTTPDNGTPPKYKFAMPASDVTVTATFTENSSGGEASAATVTTAPTATTGDITAGSNTALVTAGVANGGTMMYAVTTENTKPTSTEGFTATVPTAESITAAGTVYVWYYVKADSTHTDSEIAGSVTVTVNAAPAAGTTVTWDSTNVFVEANQIVYVSRFGEPSATFEGITIAFNGESNSRFNPYDYTPEGYAATLLVYGNYGDSFIFTAPTGKLFSRIEIISSNSFYVFTAYGDWTEDNDNNKIVWSGTPSSSVTLGGDDLTEFDSLESIVFTLVDAN